MLFVISPAKSLDYETPVAPSLLAAATQPAFAVRAAELVKLLKPMSAQQVGQLMDLSPELSALNVGRYRAWSKTSGPHNGKPAVLAFNGDVYDGLAARTLSDADLAWLQCHVAILSGLYGVLRPMDWLQPYRLEMGTRLANPRGRDLYAYWGDTVAEHLNTLAAANESPVIVNLASQEYFRAADRPALAPRVIECVFEDWKNGRYKIISFFAKRARGLMVRYAAVRRIVTPKGLEGFDLDGYRFDGAASEPDRLVFRRKVSE
ncbi:peroxide stress protein YaaA [Aquincola sp. MAHUQ-54]|uniref:UPF0246 protein V4F39_11100 n=1 Tax=Aquincola agrisoli TaxID=3119538 RepID=A0AAW9Q3P5_9BURK